MTKAEILHAIFQERALREALQAVAYHAATHWSASVWHKPFSKPTACALEREHSVICENALNEHLARVNRSS